jgi:hypothetical protein
MRLLRDVANFLSTESPSVDAQIPMLQKTRTSCGAFQVPQSLLVDKMLYSSEYLTIILCLSGIWMTAVRGRKFQELLNQYYMWSFYLTWHAFDYGTAPGVS